MAYFLDIMAYFLDWCVWQWNETMRACHKAGDDSAGVVIRFVEKPPRFLRRR